MIINFDWDFYFIVKPKSKVPKSRPKGLGLTLKSLLSLKECSGKKVLIVKVFQNDPLDSSSQKIVQTPGVQLIKDVG